MTCLHDHFTVLLTRLDGKIHFQLLVWLDIQRFDQVDLNENIVIFIYQRYTIRWQRQFLQASSESIHSIMILY